jgi:hypothetical protein
MYYTFCVTDEKYTLNIFMEVIDDKFHSTKWTKSQLTENSKL